MNHERFKDADQITIYFNGYCSVKAVILLARQIEEVLNTFCLDSPKEAAPKDIISFNPFVSGRFASLKLDDTYAVFPIIDTVLKDFFSSLEIDAVANMPVNYLEFVIHQGLLETNCVEEFARITQKKFALALKNQDFCFSLQFEQEQTSFLTREKMWMDKELSEQRHILERESEMSRQLIQEEEQTHYHRHQVEHVIRQEDLARQDLIKQSTRFFYKLDKKSDDFCARQVQILQKQRVFQQEKAAFTRHYELSRSKIIKSFTDSFSQLKSQMQQEKDALDTQKLKLGGDDSLKDTAVALMDSKEILTLHLSLFEQYERGCLIKSFNAYSDPVMRSI